MFLILKAAQRDSESIFRLKWFEHRMEQSERQVHAHIHTEWMNEWNQSILVSAVCPWRKQPTHTSQSESPSCCLFLFCFFLHHSDSKRKRNPWVLICHRVKGLLTSPQRCNPPLAGTGANSWVHQASKYDTALSEVLLLWLKPMNRLAPHANPNDSNTVCKQIKSKHHREQLTHHIIITEAVIVPDGYLSSDSRSFN